MFGFFRTKVKRLFVLVFEENTLHGFIFQQYTKRYEYVISDSIELQAGFSDETLVLDDVDKLLDTVERKIGARVDEVMYVIPDAALDIQREVVDPYRAVIKSITKNLELKAIGYIQESELPDAVHLSEKLTILLNEKDSHTEVYSTDSVDTEDMQDAQEAVSEEEYIGEELRTHIEPIIVSTSDEERDTTDHHRLVAGMETPPQENDSVLDAQEQSYYVGPFLINGDIMAVSQAVPNSATRVSNTTVFTTMTNVLYRLWSAGTASIFRGNKIIWIFLLCVGLIVSVVSVIEMLTHRAQIHITFTSQSLHEKVSFTVDQTTPDTVQQTLSFKIPTTGKKDVGTAARGEIQLYNFELSPKTFASGTELKTSGGIMFLTETPITVAAAKQNGPNIQAGNVKVKVVAAEIGTNGNIPTDTQLSVGAAPSSKYYAQTTQALTGGSSKIARVVERADITAVREGLDTQAKKFIATYKVKDALIILPDLTKTTMKNVVYSHDVDEESDYIEVRADVHIDFILVSQEKIAQTVATELKKNIKSGLVLQEQKLEFHITRATDKGGVVTIVADTQARLMPVFDSLPLREMLRFKTFDRVSDIVRTYTQKKYPNLRIDTVDVQTSSLFNLLRKRLPYISQYITITYR